MMEVLAGAKAHIRSISAEVFADRLWHRWADYVGAAGASVRDLTPVVTRQYVWHLSEVLGIGGEAGDLWHPFENWISPPLQPNRAHTGDVFDIDGDLWVVLRSEEHTSELHPLMRISYVVFCLTHKKRKSDRNKHQF